MNLYHKVHPNDLGSVLANGLQRTSRGDLGSDKSIVQTDAYLDQRRPEGLKSKQVSRDDNIYAFLEVEGKIVDITDGALVPIKRFIAESKQKVVCLTVDPKRCFVSDLDTYDALKAAIEQHEKGTPERLTHSYWSKLTPLSEYRFGTFRRPEVMVTYDVDPTAIRLL